MPRLERVGGTLEHLGLTEYEAAEAEKLFYQHDRDAVRQLAILWDPNKPPSENKAYLERAKALEVELEFALSSKAEEDEQSA